jgi:two-component system LytT family response regulator
VIRALIVDDEPLARRGIHVRLEAESDFTIVGEAEDGNGALEAIRVLAPDLVFLDVQMPALDGFEVLERVAPERLPMVVFVTAHDAHALRAFEVHALDYLLKPFSEERFRDCLERAREAFAHGGNVGARQRVRELLERLRHAGADERPRRFAVRDRGHIEFVSVTDLCAVEAAENYVTLVTERGRHLLRLTLADMEQQLDPSSFARIHRSTIVNLDRVREIVPDSHGDCDVRLANGTVYRLSRGFRDRLVPRRRGA